MKNISLLLAAVALVGGVTTVSARGLFHDNSSASARLDADTSSDISAAADDNSASASAAGSVHTSTDLDASRSDDSLTGSVSASVDSSAAISTARNNNANLSVNFGGDSQAVISNSSANLDSAINTSAELSGASSASASVNGNTAVNSDLTLDSVNLSSDTNGSLSSSLSF